MSKEKPVSAGPPAKAVPLSSKSQPPRPDDKGKAPELSPPKPEPPEYVAAWANMTTGLEDYAEWRTRFEGRTGAGDPPFRRGRIWT